MTEQRPARDPQEWWVDAALAEQARLQSEYRDLQKQSHAVVAGGIAVGTLSLTLAASISLNMALLLAVLATGAAFAWYMNINAEASAVAVARNHLIARINSRVGEYPRGERVAYSDLIGGVGANARGTTWMVVVMICAYAGFLLLGIALSFSPPSALQDNTWLHEPWREVLQIIVSLVTARAAVAALLENRRYRRRIREAIRNDPFSTVVGTALASPEPVSTWFEDLQWFARARDTH